MRAPTMLCLCLFALAGGCGAPAEMEPHTAAQAQGVTAAGCDLRGVWAWHIAVPVRWPATVAVEAGEGVVSQWGLSQRQADGLGWHDQVELCATAVPDLRARKEFKSDLYGIDLPASAFAASRRQKLQVNGRLDHDGPQSPFHLGGIVVLLGAALPNAASAPWPAPGKGLQLVDDDGDGHPGVTILARREPPYRPPPVNMFRTKFAAEFYVALRNVVERIDGQLEGCDLMRGTASIPTLAGKTAINSHIVGCRRTDGKMCTRAEVRLVNSMQSGYQLSAPPVLVMRRVKADTTCQTVRQQALSR